MIYLLFKVQRMFVVYRCYRMKCYEGKKKKKSIDKMKTNSYRIGNARFSYTKFAKSKSYLPITNSVFFVGT